MKRFVFIFAIVFSVHAAAQKKPIRPFELPKEATAFVEKNFPYEAIHHSWKRVVGTDTIYKVSLASLTEIEFDREGNWLEVDGNGAPARPAFLSAPIIDFIKKNYAGQRLAKAKKESKKMEVTLTGGMRLAFDLNGKFLNVLK